jgi:phospholipid/cholesterol/gamma-HCH transport system permease protein
MSAAAYAIRHSDAGRTLEISGDWSALTLGEQASKLEQALAGATGPTRLDLSGVGRLDTAGAYAILKATLPTLETSSLPTETSRLFELVRPIVEEQGSAPPQRSMLFAFLVQFGRAIVDLGKEMRRAAELGGPHQIERGRAIPPPTRRRGN